MHLLNQLKVALFINFVTPYHRPVFKLLRQKTGSLRIYISVKMEPNRNWEPNWEGLDVVLQRNLMINRSWRHPKGFTDTIYIHIPYDTVFRLFRDRPQVVISTEMGMRSLQALFYRLIKRSSRLILWLPLSEHTEQGRGWLREIMRKLLLKKADAILVNGKSGVRYIKNYGVDERRIFRVPYPTDLTDFGNSNLTRDRKIAHRLLYVGQLTHRKGIIPFLETLIKWATDHPSRKIEFAIVGEGELHSEIASRPIPANLNLELIGHQPYEVLHETYSNSGIFVFPTFADEWGIVVNEALLSGLPVLGSVYSQAVEELVEDGKSGWHFIPDDPQDVYRLITRALDTPLDVLHKMRVLGQEKAESCNPENVTNKMLEALSFVLQKY